MAIDYVMPKLAMAMNEGTINEWLVEEGDYVETGAELASIETEKVAYDVESPVSGYIHILVPAGETVACEALVARFAESEQELVELQTGSVGSTPQQGEIVKEAEQSTATAAEAELVTGGERIKASPLARKLAADSGLDLARVTGTGPGGRIVKRDVLAARDSSVGTEASAVEKLILGGAGQILSRIPMQGMRKAIATRMTQSLHEAAQLSSGWESDITDLIDVRRGFVEREQQLGTRVSMNAFVIKALIYAVRTVPIANSCLEGDEIVVYGNINLGVAISVPGAGEFDSGLMVGVLHNVERMGVVDIDIAMKALVKRVREGSATTEDLAGSTITLSSTAGIAPPGMTTTPVLNLPNVALLGPSTPVERPAVYKGEIVPRTFMPISFTFDHRALDGEPAARFMQAVHECLENPELMLA